MKLRIRDWNKHFENNRTRELKRMDWIPVPNRMDGEGYTALVDHPNGAEHLGAWLAILEISSRRTERGTLPQDGAEIPRALARISRLPVAVFEEVLPRLLQIGWIEQFGEIPQDGAEIPQDDATACLRARVTEGNGTEGNGTETITAPTDAPVTDSLPLNTLFAVQAQKPDLKTLQLQWFEEWWRFCWRKEDHKRAQKAFQKLVRTQATFELVMAATKAQTPKMLASEVNFRPLPTTWLNGERWHDEATAPTNTAQRNPKRASSALDSLLEELG